MKGRMRSRSFAVNTSPGLKSGLASSYLANHSSKVARVKLLTSCAIAGRTQASVPATPNRPASAVYLRPASSVVLGLRNITLNVLSRTRPEISQRYNGRPLRNPWTCRGQGAHGVHRSYGFVIPKSAAQHERRNPTQCHQARRLVKSL